MKVTAVYRKKFVIHLEGLTKQSSREKKDKPVGVHPSNVQITYMKLDADRKAKLQAKKRGRTGGSAMEVEGGNA